VAKAPSPCGGCALTNRALSALPSSFLEWVSLTSAMTLGGLPNERTDAVCRPTRWSRRWSPRGSRGSGRRNRFESSPRRGGPSAAPRRLRLLVPDPASPPKRRLSPKRHCLRRDTVSEETLRATDVRRSVDAAKLGNEAVWCWSATSIGERMTIRSDGVASLNHHRRVEPRNLGLSPPEPLRPLTVSTMQCFYS
jgi:hypothetical protein